MIVKLTIKVYCHICGRRTNHNFKEKTEENKLMYICQKCKNENLFKPEEV